MQRRRKVAKRQHLEVAQAAGLRVKGSGLRPLCLDSTQSREPQEYGRNRIECGRYIE